MRVRSASARRRALAGERRRAFDDGRVPVAIEPDQPLRSRQDVASRHACPTRRCAPHDQPRRASAIQRAVHQAQRGTGAARRVWRFAWSCIAHHDRCLARLFGQPPVIVGRQNLAGHRRRRLHDEPADLALELGEHARALALGGFARADEDLLGGGDRLPRLLRLRRARRPRGPPRSAACRRRRPSPARPGARPRCGPARP